LQPLALLLWHHPQTKLYQNHSTQVQVNHPLIETLAVKNLGVIHSVLPRLLHNEYTYKVKTTLTHLIIVLIKKLKAHDIELYDEWEWQMASRTDHLFGTFSKLQKATIIIIMSVHLSIQPYRTQLLLDRLSWNPIYKYFLKTCQ
jgi:hypothetical protein